MKKALLVLGILLGINCVLFAQTQPDGNRAFKHVQYLASDDFKGRRAGTPEYQKAAEYVAEKMKEYGLKPGNNGSYFQDVVFKKWNNFEQPIRLEIIQPEHRIYFASYSRDYFPVRGTGSGIVKGKLVFVGYGIVSEEAAWDDYKNVDVHNRIVVIMPDAPKTFADDLAKEWTFQKKVQTAIEKGAAGVLYMNITQNGYLYRRGFRLEKGICPAGFIVMVANRDFLNDAFYLDHQSWHYLVSKTIRMQKSFTTSLDVTVEMEAHYTEVDSLTAPNVIGVLPGKDKNLKNEYIILGGHLDHLGVGIDGYIYNGADDNAASVAVILELARVFQANGFRPDRTVVFASWAGEELGLVGSRYYTEHPIYPLDKTVVYINMDMVGCGDEDMYIGGMWEFADFYNLIKPHLDEEFQKRLHYRLHYRGSDHSAFLPKGVTAISLRSGGLLSRKLDDEHPEYHRPGDTPDIIEPELLQSAAKYHYEIIQYLAKTKENLLDPKHHIQFVHKDATVVDLHCDTIMRYVRGADLTKDNEDGHIDIPKLKQGAVDLQVFACYVGPPQNEKEKMQAAERAFRFIDGVHQLTEQNPADLSIVTNYDEFRRLEGTGKIGILIGIEGGYAIESDLRLLRSFYTTGVRMMTLTHWTHTDWADASGDTALTFGGLSEFGEKVVREMNRLGMIVDVSHANDETFWDVIRITDSPIVASHSCSRAVSEHHRNLSDDMLKALAENGGVVGINFSPGFLNSDNDKKINALRAEVAKKYGLPTDRLALRQANPELQGKFRQEFQKKLKKLKKELVPVTVKTVVDHIDHMVEVMGNADHIGLGSDFDGISNTPIGLENASKLSNITKELLARGYKEEDVRKILGGNFIRVFKEVCK